MHNEDDFANPETYNKLSEDELTRLTQGERQEYAAKMYKAQQGRKFY